MLDGDGGTIHMINSAVTAIMQKMYQFSSIFCLLFGLWNNIRLRRVIISDLQNSGIFKIKVINELCRQASSKIPPYIRNYVYEFISRQFQSVFYGQGQARQQPELMDSAIPSTPFESPSSLSRQDTILQNLSGSKVVVPAESKMVFALEQLKLHEMSEVSTFRHQDISQNIALNPGHNTKKFVTMTKERDACLAFPFKIAYNFACRAA
jgi:hypothetical protein